MTDKNNLIQDSFDFSKFIFSHNTLSSIHPVTYTLTGASAYGLSNKASKEYVGVHLTNTEN